ncbi:HAMP domain-containing sensor histidine kinase [Niabella yanshanensis]|uniref:histidine kinase n=1 Tax=Niabella yanshanensis TaxID=577386 RepID=A0ABZ0WDJ5_9BACT|nr:HAMP domain-containing sensor histidine kinase [Niabella yanshanensis]WQD40763.1 HAMP domain-containing sensor histidine kinase [Niabella yanshanensis]
MVRYWKWLMGDKDHFTLEGRIFNATCIALIICVLLYSPISYFLLTMELFLILVGMAFLVGILYYLSRFKGLSGISATLFQIALNIALVVNYYYNSGIDGPNHIIFLVAFFISAATAPIKQYYIWLPLNILLLSGIMMVEYTHPNFIELTYSDTTSRFVDIFFSYLGIVIFIFIVTMFVRRSYNRQREELIAKSIALEEANNTKNKLLSILGHDLKEPLASLQGYLELLADFELDEQEQKEMNAQLLSMTRNTSFMLSNILAWTRAQEQRLSADLQILGVKDVLTHVVELARSISLKKDISFEIDLPRHIYVKADAQMLALIIRNLLMNAIKFTRKGGNIWITATTEGDQCTVMVKDDGIGIPDAMQPGIFRMESGPRRGTESEKGTGLGLMLCQEFAVKIGGHLNFTSRPEKGTTFSLKLPAAPMPVVFIKKDREVNNEALELTN